MPHSLLLIDDSKTDAHLTRLWLSESELVGPIHIEREGSCALEWLRTTGERPNLVLLDINLLGEDGFGVLSEIKQDDDLRDLRVIMLTGSTSAEDVDRASELKAERLITKPCDADGFVEFVRTIEQYLLRPKD